MSSQVDVEIQEMCSKHAMRKPVTITRGGNRARLRVVMPNGGVTLVTYDTRVTSRVCGRVIYVHSDNTEVTDVHTNRTSQNGADISLVSRVSPKAICILTGKTKTRWAIFPPPLDNPPPSSLLMLRSYEGVSPTRANFAGRACPRLLPLTVGRNRRFIVVLFSLPFRLD